MAEKKSRFNSVLTVVFSILSVLYISPIFIVLMNSFKKKAYISRQPFAFPTGKMLVGLENYVEGIKKIKFFEAAGWSFFITVASVFVIVLCTSMCAWYITRVASKFCRAFYYACVFSMAVPFQMVMFTLSMVANRFRLTSPFTIPIVYLGFGAGLAVFMFAGFAKGIPLEIEEAATIDGCSPPGIFFRVVLPVMKPTYISVAILETMWVWNGYLLPYLVLDKTRGFETIPIAIQKAVKDSYGTVDTGVNMALLVLAILPVIVFYALCQKHIVKGVMAGAVKG